MTMRSRSRLNEGATKQVSTWLKNDAYKATGGGGNFPTGCQAYYSFDSGYTDITGNGYDLTQVGTPTASTGILNGDYNFNTGSDNYFYTTSMPDISGDFSITGWIKTTSQGIIMWFSGSPNMWMSINADGYHYFHSNDGNDLFGTTNLRDGNWHFFAMTVERGVGVECYVDGSNVGSLGSAGTTSSKLGIATWADNTGYNPLNGDLDELGIWSRVLTPTEISNLYNGGSGTPYA